MELTFIQAKIHQIRGHKIILDYDLADLYEVETRHLKQSVRRNLRRFPSDFMFELSNEEINLMVSQNVIPSKSYFGGASPFAFTEQGVAMLSSVLNNEKAIDVNIAIMRAFVSLRRYALTFSEIADKILLHDKNLEDINEVLKFLAEENQQRFDEITLLKNGEETVQDWKDRAQIGFKK
jgi:ORF6N domain